MQVGDNTMILLCGKSGTGKDYLVKTFNLKPVVSHTTRKPRENETNGISKWFHDSYSSNKKNQIAYTYFNFHHYWATTDDLYLKDVYIIDANGIAFMKNKYGKKFDKNFTIVYLSCAWYKRLYRLIKRDGLKQGLKRFINDITAFKDIKKFSYTEVRM